MPLESRSQRAAIRPCRECERLLRIHSADEEMGHDLACELSVIVDDGLLIRPTVPHCGCHLDGMQGVRGSNPLSSTLGDTAFPQLSWVILDQVIAPPA